MKLDGIRAAQKEHWQEEVERLTAMIEKDQATIAAQLSRRVFIRAWYALMLYSSRHIGLCYLEYTACGMSSVSCCTTGKMHS